MVETSANIVHLWTAGLVQYVWDERTPRELVFRSYPVRETGLSREDASKDFFTYRSSYVETYFYFSNELDRLPDTLTFEQVVEVVQAHHKFKEIWRTAVGLETLGKLSYGGDVIYRFKFFVEDGWSYIWDKGTSGAIRVDPDGKSWGSTAGWYDAVYNTEEAFEIILADHNYMLEQGLQQEFEETRGND